MQGVPQAAKTGMDSQQLIREFYKRYNAGNVEGVLALMSDDIEYHDMVSHAQLRWFLGLSTLVQGDPERDFSGNKLGWKQSLKA